MNNKSSVFIPDSQKESNGLARISTNEDTNLFPDSRKVEHVFSAYKAPIGNVKPHTTMTMANVFEYISGNTFERVTDEVRAITDVIEQGKYKTQNFHYVTFSGTFTSRANNKLKAHSGLLCIDVDKLDNVAPLRLQIIEALPPSLLFVSPRGNGLKLVYKISINEGTHLDYFFALRQFFSERFDTKIDDSCKDVSRACFLSHDPDAYFNDDDDTLLDKAFVDTFPLDIPHTPKKDKKSVTAPKNPQKIDVTAESTIFSKLKTWLEKKQQYSDGNRHNYIVQLSAACNRFGVQKSYVEQQLTQYSDGCSDHIKTTIEGIYNDTSYHGTAKFDNDTPYTFEGERQKLQPGEETPTPLLPIDGFPKPLQNFINEYTTIYNVPRDYIAASVLFSTGLAIGDKMELKGKYNNVPILWMSIIGNVSSGKTDPLDRCLQYFDDKDKLSYDVYNEQRRAYEANKELKKNEQDPSVQLPAYFQYIVKDSTPEGLCNVHQANSRGFAIYRDELKGWLDDFNRYNKSGEQSTMLSSFYRISMSVNRAGKEPIRIENPCLFVAGGIQVDLLPDLAKDSRADNGFLSRIAHVYPDTDFKRPYNNGKLHPDTLPKFYRFLDTLASMPEVSDLTLSSEAESVYCDWFNDNARQTNEEPKGYLKGVYGKLDVIILRVAIILHGMKVVHDANTQDVISADTMKQAANIAEYFRRTALKVYHKIFIEKSDPKPDKKTVIKYLVDSGATQSEVSRILNVDQSYISRILKKS
jgi:hypothetical protein